MADGTRDGAPLEERIARIRRPAGIALAALGLGYLWLVARAPVDSVQGVIQKVLYVHPPLAYGAYLGFVLTAVCGALYLWRNREAYDQLAVAGAEVGVVFCTLMMITGPIWAKGTWGHWWSWDPRLTLTLLLWFVYLSYLLLRSFTEGGARAARFASVYGIAGTLLIPLNYFVIDMFQGRSMHPENLERGSLGAGMGLPFLVANVTFFVAFVYLVILRWEVEIGRARSCAPVDESPTRWRCTASGAASRASSNAERAEGGSFGSTPTRVSRSSPGPPTPGVQGGSFGHRASGTVHQMSVLPARVLDAGAAGPGRRRPRSQGFQPAERRWHDRCNLVRPPRNAARRTPRSPKTCRASDSGRPRSSPV
jgi:heme exporter protein C